MEVVAAMGFVFLYGLVFISAKGGVNFIKAYKSKKDAEADAKKIVEDNPEYQVQIIELEAKKIVAEFKGKDFQDRRNIYNEIKKKKSNELSSNNQLRKNAHEENLLNLVYGNNRNIKLDKIKSNINMQKETEYEDFMKQLSLETGVPVENIPLTLNQYTERSKNANSIGNLREELLESLPKIKSNRLVANANENDMYGNLPGYDTKGGRRLKNRTKRRRNGRRTSNRR